MLKIQMCFLLLCNSSESWANLCADQCSRTMQQCEHRVAVRDGPGVSDSGLRCAVISGPQCGRLVPLTSHLPSKSFSTGHKHTRPVPGKGDHSQVRSSVRHYECVNKCSSFLFFQSYFSRGGAPFIGMIVSPYDPANPSPHSQTTCLLVKESQEPSGSQSKLNITQKYHHICSGLHKLRV